MFHLLRLFEGIRFVGHELRRGLVLITSLLLLLLLVPSGGLSLVLADYEGHIHAALLGHKGVVCHVLLLPLADSVIAPPGANPQAHRHWSVKSVPSLFAPLARDLACDVVLLQEGTGISSCTTALLSGLRIARVGRAWHEQKLLDVGATLGVCMGRRGLDSCAHGLLLLPCDDLGDPSAAGSARSCRARIRQALPRLIWLANGGTWITAGVQILLRVWLQLLLVAIVRVVRQEATLCAWMGISSEVSADI